MEAVAKLELCSRAANEGGQLSFGDPLMQLNNILTRNVTVYLVILCQILGGLPE